MGKLYKRNGVYQADYYDRAGNRQRRSLKTADKDVAKARLRDLELATTDSAPHETEALTAALKYFVDVVHAGSPPKTVSCYRQKSCHLLRVLGDGGLDGLTAERFERYVATRLAEGAHTHTVHKELVVARGTLKSARKRGTFHGALDIVPRFESGYVPRTTYLTFEQFQLVAQFLVPPLRPGAKQRTREKRALRLRKRLLYCLLIAYASPRRGEIEALQWEHIDLRRGTIALPKGKTVGRTVAIHDELRPILEALHEGTGPVVHHWGNMGRDLPAACARAGVPRCTANDLRRTFGSWLIQAGVSNRIVADLLGHGTTRMVDVVYGRIDEATRHAAIARLPGSRDAGVTHSVPRQGTGGAPGTPAGTTIDGISVENVVPRVGIEPTTRGFSVRCSTN